MNKSDFEPPQASQASSHFPLEPISGLTLFELEMSRAQDLKRKGSLRTGCKEIDQQVLVDGFEHGSVVGISAEELEVGLVIALQTIAHYLASGLGRKPSGVSAAIITTSAAPAILPTLRDAIQSRVQDCVGRDSAEIGPKVRECLERVSISRVFDIEGLWEVLSEIEVESSSPRPDDTQQTHSAPPAEQPVSSPLSSPPLSPSPPPSLLRREILPPLRAERSEVMDSEDDDEELSPSPLTSSPLEPAVPPIENLQSEGMSSRPQPPTAEHSSVPGIILITHFFAHLNALFTQRDKTSSHTTLQLLASHLRYLSRSAGPLIILLNSTTSNNTTSSGTSNLASLSSAATGQPSTRAIDPTLRSIFNPPPPSHVGYRNNAAGLALSRKNKPSFGLTFTQFLDLHLLCTRVPKTRRDAESVFVPRSEMERAGFDGGGRVRHAWVVEVLLDESGSWDEHGRRTSREQRWGAVEVRDGVRVVDTFAAAVDGKGELGPIRLAAGFGGRRV